VIVVEIEKQMDLRMGFWIQQPVTGVTVVHVQSLKDKCKYNIHGTS
jgi:hypothetical protein